MTREEKIAKRKARAKKRADAHCNKYRERVTKAREMRLPSCVPLSCVTNGGHWQDLRSETGYSQNCDMGGTCQFPCNGDC